MKIQKTRATATQFETALVEELKHARGQNIPANALSSVTSFALLVAARLYGRERKLGAELQGLYDEIRYLAVEERKEADREDRRRETEAREEAESRKKRRESDQRIILPGGWN